MKINDNPPVHLTYCLNIHPGESWQENFEAIKNRAMAVRENVCPGKPFGLGLRLGNESVSSLIQDRGMSVFRDFLSANNLYVFTVNGFPYGSFHETRVKENVYKPDWLTRERVDYTIKLVQVLEYLLPQEIQGSISTVPGSYKKWIKSGADVAVMVRNIVECVKHMDLVYRRSGKTICLALEPEPDCFIEKTREAVEFFKESLFRQGVKDLAGLAGLSLNEAEESIRRHVGICFDTCHIALQFEDLEESLRSLIRNGISVPKVQLSSAISAPAGQIMKLSRFVDKVYLHQVRIRDVNGSITSFDDLTPEVIGKPMSGINGEARVHFHVPLYFSGNGEIGSTSGLLTRKFFKLLLGVESYLEIETYTYGVLPDELRSRDVSLSITDEFKWVLEEIRS